MYRMRKTFVSALLIVVLIISSLALVAADNGTSKAIGQQDIIYFVMTDRFYNGDTSNDIKTNPKDIRAHHGGDFQGLIDKLDYIKELGATAVWVTPVVQNSFGGYHGYWAIDFYKVDEHLGDLDKMKELVAKAHEKGIKIIVDLVVNHTSPIHPWVGNESYKDWFHQTGNINNWNDQKEVENGKLAGLPDLAQENPEVAKYLIDMAKWWIKETGIDGFRLDTVRHVPKDFWVEFTTEIKKDYPDFYMIGEVWSGDHSYLNEYQQVGLDGLVDFPMHFAINDVFGRGKGMGMLKAAIDNSSIYKNRYLYGTFIDNHDVSRFVNVAGSKVNEKLKQALTFQMTYTGIPIIYYGTEIAMEGGEDPNNRKSMDWEKESEVRDYMKKLTKLRKDNTVFTMGDIKVLNIADSYIAYSRSYMGETAIVLLNTKNQESAEKLTVPVEIVGRGKQLVNVFNENDTLSADGNEISLVLQAKESRIYMLKDRKTDIYLIYFVIVFSILALSAVIVMTIKRSKNKK